MTFHYVMIISSVAFDFVGRLFALVLSVLCVLLESRHTVSGECIYGRHWRFLLLLTASISDSSMSLAALCIGLFFSLFYFFQDILDWHRTIGPVWLFFFFFFIIA